MKLKKSIWATVTGGFTSVAPILLSCCKSGACVGVCASPVASLFGVSSATIASSPLVILFEPILIALSAISFTVSYYSLYVLPKTNCTTGNCDCKPDEKEIRKVKINKAIFWIGLVLSIGFLSYFEYSKYQAASNVETCGVECVSDTENDCRALTEEGNCEQMSENDSILRQSTEQSEITCPKCGHKKMETLPTDVCLISYTCEKCAAVLHPKEGDCCVFCTYGDHKCPSKQ